MRGLAAGLGVMLVDDGGADGEGGGGSVCNSVELQLVRTLRRGRCSGVAAAAGGTTRPAALAVVLGALGCSGSIPGSPWLGR